VSADRDLLSQQDAGGWRQEYEAKLKEAQQIGVELSRNIQPVVWKKRS
jgi:hypothetical protein